MIHARTACRHRTVPCVSVQRSFEMFFLVRAFYPERGKRLLTNVLLTRLPESEGAPIAGVYVLLTHLHASVLLTHLHVRYIRSRRERRARWSLVSRTACRIVACTHTQIRSLTHHALCAVHDSWPSRFKSLAVDACPCPLEALTPRARRRSEHNVMITATYPDLRPNTTPRDF